MSKRAREKPCHKCQKAKDVLYRARIEQGGDWVFTCADCLKLVKPDNPHYCYGGTWKAHKKG